MKHNNDMYEKCNTLSNSLVYFPLQYTLYSASNVNEK